ncbi:MAG: type V CRISPR-associated endonuclease Cas1 [Bacteroidales bacterium]|nr:type V CRISPR-associated endonuclease Cas1 [Bacteroidales bacterium]
MFTKKDIEFKSIYVINCLEKRNLRVSNGEMLLEDTENKKTLTKLPFQKILAIFVIGSITITTPLIEKCLRNNVALVVMKMNLRPVFFLCNSAEANFLLRKKQYELNKEDISIAKILMYNKIQNQLTLLVKTRKKDIQTMEAVTTCKNALDKIGQIEDYNELMGMEGMVAKNFFKAYFQEFEWNQRKPRMKCDYLNVTMDIGYTVLFNFVEVFVRMFGFDVYCGVYHRLWFKRKSLICDLVEPFRCIIDYQIRKSYNLKQFNPDDFIKQRNEVHLQYNKASEYYKIFYQTLIEYKVEIFTFVQKYYRCFMQGDFDKDCPMFSI